MILVVKQKISRFIIAVTIAAFIAVVSILQQAGVHAAPQTFTVTNTNDSGAGSLRQAIYDANSNANPADVDVIEFNIAGGGVQTITPSFGYSFAEPVTINGYTQPGAAENTADWPAALNGTLTIEIDGSAVADPALFS